MYLIFEAQNSINVSRKTKDLILFEIVTNHLQPHILQQPDFPKFYAALSQNIRANLDYIRHVKRTGLLPSLYKLDMISNLILGRKSTTYSAPR